MTQILKKKKSTIAHDTYVAFSSVRSREKEISYCSLYKCASWVVQMLNSSPEMWHNCLGQEERVDSTGAAQGIEGGRA